MGNCFSTGNKMNRHWQQVVFAVVFAFFSTALIAQNEYQIGAGDTLAITVFGEEDLSPEVRVTERGTIPYPFLGEINVDGLTAAELEQRILEGLKGPYLVNPSVAVSVIQYRPFYINGQVNKPGGLAWEPGMTVRKAISLAGGLSERASERKIYLLREGAQSEDLRERVNLEHLVRPGDIITVEESFF